MFVFTVIIWYTFLFQEEITEEIGIHPVNSIPNTPFRRTSDFLTHPVFNRYCQDNWHFFWKPNCSDTEITKKAEICHFGYWPFVSDWQALLYKTLYSMLMLIVADVKPGYHMITSKRPPKFKISCIPIDMVIDFSSSLGFNTTSKIFELHCPGGWHWLSGSCKPNDRDHDDFTTIKLKYCFMCP